jgi:hypothetical protein
LCGIFRVIKKKITEGNRCKIVNNDGSEFFFVVSCGKFSDAVEGKFYGSDLFEIFKVIKFVKFENLQRKINNGS